MTADNAGRDTTWALGFKYNFTRSLALRLDWQRYFDLGDSFVGNFNVDTVLVGIMFKF